jgi:hypothetical protein
MKVNVSKTNLGLVQHAQNALKEHWGYVFGCYGSVLTESLLQSKLNQYPDNVKQYESFIRANWMNKQVTDCVGLIKSYLWWTDKGPIYNSKTDTSADGMYNAAKEKGPISSIPEIPGLCVRKPGHIGVYIGNGWVIESKGTKYGVVQTPLKGAGANTWTHWLKCPFIEYVIENKEESTMGKAFKDVEDSRWSAKHIEAAKELGLISGNKDGTFNPTGTLTREQAAVLIVELYEKITGKKVVK